MLSKAGVWFPELCSFLSGSENLVTGLRLHLTLTPDPHVSQALNMESLPKHDSQTSILTLSLNVAFSVQRRGPGFQGPGLQGHGGVILPPLWH